MQRIHRFNAYTVSLHLLLVALALTVLGLAGENRDLQSPASIPSPPQLEAGATITPFSARDLDGQAELLSFTQSERERLLFVFTTVCSVCLENQPIWSSLYARARGEYDIVGISLNELEASLRYREANDLPFPVVVPDDIREFATENKISRVPLTVHIGRDGKVLGSWLGILSEDSLAQLTAIPWSAVGG